MHTIIPLSLHCINIIKDVEHIQDRYYDITDHMVNQIDMGGYWGP